uniref:Uncharacterized protein n=1 Tax=Ascaris lumbricoides TaxID=6252 RepID=A0A0M3I967_ASCLU
MIHCFASKRRYFSSTCEGISPPPPPPPPSTYLSHKNGQPSVMKNLRDLRDRCNREESTGYSFFQERMLQRNSTSPKPTFSRPINEFTRSVRQRKKKERIDKERAHKT